jgi:hypothetical protein
VQTREGSNWIITGMLSLHPHQQIEETGEATAHRPPVRHHQQPTRRAA